MFSKTRLSVDRFAVVFSDQPVQGEDESARCSCGRGITAGKCVKSTIELTLV